MQLNPKDFEDFLTDAKLLHWEYDHNVEEQFDRYLVSFRCDIKPSDLHLEKIYTISGIKLRLVSWNWEVNFSSDGSYTDFDLEFYVVRSLFPKAVQG